jgi:hypothetical protein
MTWNREDLGKEPIKDHSFEEGDLDGLMTPIIEREYNQTIYPELPAGPKRFPGGLEDMMRRNGIIPPVDLDGIRRQMFRGIFPKDA